MCEDVCVSLLIICVCRHMRLKFPQSPTHRSHKYMYPYARSVSNGSWRLVPVNKSLQQNKREIKASFWFAKHKLVNFLEEVVNAWKFNHLKSKKLYDFPQK